MNTTNDLKTFESLPFGARSSAVGNFAPIQTAQIDVPMTTLPYFPVPNPQIQNPGRNPAGGGIIDGTLVKTVQVVDTDTGLPLEKANVFAKANPTRGGSTDANGEITLVAQSPLDVIVFQYQDKKIERVFHTLGSMINIDTKLTQSPVVVGGTGAKIDSKFNFLKWGGIAIGAVVLLNMLSEDKPKKVTV